MTTLTNLKAAKTLEELAGILGYKASTLAYITYKIPDTQKYAKFKIPKRNGGEREICAPTDRLKTLQRHLANVLYACRDAIDAESGRRSLSHGFRRKHSIITNARRHKRRRYVLNLDLQDFFPTFNFGRVRGFFIHNNGFKLHEKVATIIAQITCFENALPQGSPCSPIIADLIAHVLDVRLAQLAKKYQLTYSRYADDITFSTSHREFPVAIAAPTSAAAPQWSPGPELTDAIQTTGFVVNPDKTRMQFRMSRQLVTGLTVNSKVNIRPEYYRRARATCDRLFETGSYYRPATAASGPELVDSLGPIAGILSHIHHVKDTIDDRKEPEKRKDATATRRLYARFLKYRYFVRLERPLIICEGKTDSIYLKHAIRRLTAFHPKLGAFDGPVFRSAVAFFNEGSKASRVLDLGGGTGSLHYFFVKGRYDADIRSFKHGPMKHPVIVLIDNDDGAKSLFKTLASNFGITATLQSPEPFFHVTDNLYLVKTPERGETGASCIEDFFERGLLATELEGKKFNPRKDHGAAGEYGKFVFAEKVVRPNASTIDFKGFAPLLERIIAVMDGYAPPAAAPSTT